MLELRLGRRFYSSKNFHGVCLILGLLIWRRIWFVRVTYYPGNGDIFGLRFALLTVCVKGL